MSSDDFTKIVEVLKENITDMGSLLMPSMFKLTVVQYEMLHGGYAPDRSDCTETLLGETVLRQDQYKL